MRHVNATKRHWRAAIILPLCILAGMLSSPGPAIGSSAPQLYAWGSNAHGALGTGETAGTPRQAIVTGAQTVRCSGAIAYVLKADGSLWTWGGNSPSQALPSPVAGIQGIAAVSCSDHDTLALMNDGTVWGWGYNNYGQLGYAASNPIPAPGPVPGISNVLAVSAGGTVSMALAQDHSVWVWGGNASGELGLSPDTLRNRAEPGQVPGIADVKAISAGGTYCLALKSDGTVWGWGNNMYSQLGDGSALPNHVSPVQVAGLTGVVAIAASGGNISAAVKDDGTVWGWGLNDFGELGPSIGTTFLAPVKLPGFSDAVSVACGLSHIVVLKRDGTVWTMGRNIDGELGNGSATGTSTAVQVTGLSGVTTIGAAGNRSVARETDGSVWTWGANDEGQCGDGSYSSRRMPTKVYGDPGSTQVSGGAGHAVALAPDGCAWAWGINNLCQVGDGTTSDRHTPVNVAASTRFKMVRAGWYHTLALSEAGVVWSWGDNSMDAAGDPSAYVRKTPAPIAGATDVVGIGAGTYHSILVKADGTVWTWGLNSSGVLGDGSSTFRRATPGQVPGLTDITKVEAGGIHCLALTSGGEIWSWGFNGAGELGDGTTNSRSTPVQVTGLTNVSDISAGYLSSLALKTDGTVWAWGANAYGQLGDGTTINRPTPQQVQGLTGIKAIRASLFFSMALDSNGTVWVWGDNTIGPAGGGIVEARLVPTKVEELANVSAIGVGVSDYFALSPSWMPNHLAWRTQPADGNAGSLLSQQPILEVRFPDESVATDYTGPISIFVKPGSGSTGSYLNCTTTVKCVGGVASFNDISVDPAGSNYVLSAVGEGLAPVDSLPFTAGATQWAMGDLTRCLRIAAGLESAVPADMLTLNLAGPSGTIDIVDALRIARKTGGAEPNP